MTTPSPQRQPDDDGPYLQDARSAGHLERRMLLKALGLAALHPAVLAGGNWLPRATAAPPAPPVPTTVQPSTGSPSADSALSSLVTQLVRANLPEQYENRKEWDQKKAVWDGLNVGFADGQIKTKRRWKEVNHGSWKLYRAWPLNPDQELTVELKNMRPLREGLIGADVECKSRIGAFARWSEWRRGVQLFSVSADAEGHVTLNLALEIGSRLDIARFPPGIVLQPKATDADIRLDDFRLLAISNLHGTLATELGDAFEGVLRKEVRDQRGKLVEKINRQIAKNQDKLTLAANLWPFGETKEEGKP